MRLYHFLSAQYALDDIKRNRIKISLMPDLNDPFEHWTIPLRTPEERKLWKLTVDKIGKTFGVICLSEKWHNPLLWSHYADKHQGICLGFDVVGAKDITYRKSKLPYRLDFTKPSAGLSDEKMDKILYTKFQDWQYEEEWRVGTGLTSPEPSLDNPNKSLYFLDFSSQFQLREVIVGMRSNVTKAQIKAALRDGRHDNVKIIKARLAFNTFRVIRNRIGFAG
jgi:hypothetical protein